ncbi:MAG: penicillin-binding protein [Clostridia bacterium]|nr:penicillin-binding protein [Clostridia bacterium]
MESKQFTARAAMLLALLGIMLVAFTYVLYDLQVVQGPTFAAQSQRKIVRTETVEAARGQLLDRYGRVLVDNLPSYNVKLNTSFMGDARNEILLKLIKLSAEQGVVWADTLPVSLAEPFAFTLDAATTGAANNYRKYMAKLKNSEPFQVDAGMAETGDYSGYTPDAGALLNFLRAEYKVDPSVPAEDARLLVGVLYELALRSKEVSQVAYIFAQNVEIDFITAVKENQLTGVDFEATTVRQYHTDYAAHILGRVGLISSDEWPTYKDKGYSYSASVGKDGVEKAFEQYLHGTSGTRAIETNKAGKVVGESWRMDNETGKELSPVPGGNVMLTLDERLQGAVERSLSERIPQLPSKEVQGGAAVVIDVNDGGVLAMASYPTFDINTYVSNFTELSKDPLNPLYNRATLGLYPPGSTYKMVTAIGALEEGIITPSTVIRDTGRYTYYKDYQPQCWYFRQYGRTHGDEDVSEAIRDSCNVFFYDTGRRLGISELERYARMFGLGEKTGIEIPESSGVVAGPEYTEEVLGQRWNDGSTLPAAIGQENNQFTPLQLANYVATLVNGGTHYATHLLKTVKSSDFSQVLYEHEPQVLDTIDISSVNMEAVKKGMLMVAQKSSYFKDLPFEVGAKTGSAQVSSESQSNAVYVCFAPYDNPQIAVAIVVEKGGSGAELGAVAQDILNFYFSPDSTLEGVTQENTLIR